MAIADFHFIPPTLTIHAGDTVTWTNQGPSLHTATASNGSFSTRVLNKGQSRSLTFSTPGTFIYSCQIHPFMHGTLIVLAAATTPSPGSAAGPAGGHGQKTADAAASAVTSRASTPAVSRPTLPATGTNIIFIALASVALGGAGLLLRLELARTT